jgi:polysaccharide biosynthesis/export protein
MRIKNHDRQLREAGIFPHQPSVVLHFILGRLSMKKLFICATFVLVASLLALGQDDKTSVVSNPAPSQGVAPASASSGNTPWFSQRYPRYEIRPSDVFDVNFAYTPEYNQKVTVQPDGYVSLRDAGDVYVVGQTVPQVMEKIRDAYGKTLNHPLVSIVLKDFQKPYFIADGQVGHPGKYELRDDTTLSQAVAMAGGFLSSAKHSQVVLYHRVSDQWTHATLIDLKKMEKNRDMSEDVHLQPGDMVFVPKNGFSKVAPFIPTANLSMVPRTP